MPVTVTAPTNGRPSASRNHIPAGRPGRERPAMTDEETMWSGLEEPTRGSEHLFEEGGDVVAAAVQHRADQLHAHPLEAAAGTRAPPDPPAGGRAPQPRRGGAGGRGSGGGGSAVRGGGGRGRGARGAGGVVAPGGGGGGVPRGGGGPGPASPTAGTRRFVPRRWYASSASGSRGTPSATWAWPFVRPLPAKNRRQPLRFPLPPPLPPLPPPLPPLPPPLRPLPPRRSRPASRFFGASSIR